MKQNPNRLEFTSCPCYTISSSNESASDLSKSFASLWDSMSSRNNLNPSPAPLLWFQRFFVLFLSQTANWLLCKMVTVLGNSVPQFWMILSFLTHPRGGAPLPGKGIHNGPYTFIQHRHYSTGRRTRWRLRCSQNHSLTHVCPQTIIH